MVRYFWRAKYTGGQDQEQFNKDGSENNFGDIDLNELEFFEVYTDDDDARVKTFGLILKNGQFYINDVILNLAPELNTYKRKLIYFRRKQETISQLGKLPSHEVQVLGFECNIDGKVYNHMYIVDEDGRGIVRLYKK